ncbi:MAG: hypothetical protein MHM6MM_003515 [Cercozoa sp. M6MM]
MTSKPRRVKLKPEEELRFEVGPRQLLTVTLLDGSAEIFGSEMAHNRAYSFDSNSKKAVFSWHGAELQLRGETQHEYVSEASFMIKVANLHAAIEQMRKQGKSPRVMVIGPTDAGKSSLCRTLCNYAVRSDRRPIFVDMDVGQNGLAPSGCVAAKIITRTEEIASDTIESDSCDAKEAPVAFYVGHASPAGNKDRYKQCTVLLSRAVQGRLRAFEAVADSGVILNTCGWVDGLGWNIILDIWEKFEINVIVVLGPDRLFAQTKRALSSFSPSDKRNETQVVHMRPSGGVAARTRAERMTARDRSVQSYFYGSHGMLSPQKLFLKLRQEQTGDIEIYAVSQMTKSEMASTLPIANEEKSPTLEDETLLVERLESVGPELENSLVAVTFAETPEAVLQSNVAGFVHISKVHKNRTLEVLAPCAGPLPGKGLLLLGKIKWRPPHL